MASEKFWKTGTPEPPRTFTGSGNGTIEITLPVIDDTTVLDVFCGTDGDDYGHESLWNITLDLTNISNLKISTWIDELAGGNDELYILIDGEEIFSTEDTCSWTERNLDISDYEGNCELQIEAYIRQETNDQHLRFKNIKLEE